MKSEITLEIAKKMYESNEDSLKEFALLNFPELGRNKLPKSWYDLDKMKGYYSSSSADVLSIGHGIAAEDNNRNIFAKESQAEASIALAQLSQLREVYRDGWKPDWNSESQRKFLIEFRKDELIKNSSVSYSEFLSFQSKEVRDEFMENFKDLIEAAKPLMS